MTGILDLQSDLAREIVQETNVVTSPQEVKAFVHTGPVNPDAYEAYLKARYFQRQWTEEALGTAITYYQRAIEIDSTFADAFAGLGGTFSLTAIQCYQPLNEMFPRANKALIKALELDENSYRAHAELGMLMLLDWNWSAAEHEYRRVLELNPNFAEASLSYGIYLIVLGRSDEAVGVTKRALERDPLVPTSNLALGWVLYYARRFDEAIVQLKKTVEMAPNLGWPNMQLSWNYAQKHMFPEAVAECQRALKLCPEDQIVVAGCGYAYGLAGARAEALKCVTTLMRLSKRTYIDPYNFAWIYGGLGDNERALEWLERGYKEHSVSMYAVRSEIWRDELRSDPRFQNLLRRMNFPQ
jgi:tetratricopeptide (TPR) repeat protein